MRLSAHGITAQLPPGWEGAIVVAAPPPAPQVSAARGPPPRRPVVLPAAHLASFPLPPRRGDFGSGAVEVMGASDVFVALVEYGPECAGTPLFARRGLPGALRPHDFSPRALQRTLPGQAGHQSFCTAAGRAFCLYVVLGDRARAGDLVAAANQVLGAVTVSAR